MENKLQEYFDDLHSEMLKTVFNDPIKIKEASEYIFNIITEYNKFCKLYGLPIKHSLENRQ